MKQWFLECLFQLSKNVWDCSGPDHTSSICPLKVLLINIHSFIILNSSKMRTTQMSINWWIAEQKVVYPHNETLFSHKKEWSPDTCYNTDEPWKCHAKWKKPAAKDHRGYDSVYMKSHNRQIQKGRKQISSRQGPRRESGKEQRVAVGFLLQVMRMICE